MTELAFGWNNEEITHKVQLSKVSSGNFWQKTISTSFPSSIFNHRLSLRLSGSSRIVLRITAFANMENFKIYRVRNYADLSAAISPQLALKSSIEMKYENIPVPDFEHTDTHLLSSLVIKI